MTFRNAALPSLVLLCVVLLLSCGRDTSGVDRDGRVRVRLLTMQLSPTFNAYFSDLIAEYERLNPDVRIEWEDYPFDGYETKLTTAFISRNAPDVINLSAESVPSYITGGFIQPFDEHLPQEVFDSYVPQILQEGGMIDGRVYALPWYVASSVTMVNRAIVEEAGLTMDDVPLHYDDLPGFARTIREQTGKFAVFPLYTEMATLKEHLNVAGVPLFTEDRTRAVFNTPRGVEVFRFWTDLYRENLVPREALTATHRRMIELYKTGQLATLTTGPQFLPQVREDAPDVYANTVVRPEMYWRDNKRHNIALMTVTLSGQARHPDRAANFAAYLTNAQNQLAMAKLAAVLPSVTEALDDPFFAEPGEEREAIGRMHAAEQVQNGGFIFIPPPDFRRLYSSMERVTEEVAQGRKEAGPGLQEIEDRWNELLAN